MCSKLENFLLYTQNIWDLWQTEAKKKSFCLCWVQEDRLMCTLGINTQQYRQFKKETVKETNHKQNCSFCTKLHQSPLIKNRKRSENTILNLQLNLVPPLSLPAGMLQFPVCFFSLPANATLFHTSTWNDDDSLSRSTDQYIIWWSSIPSWLQMTLITEKRWSPNCTDGPQTSHLIKFYWSHWSSSGCWTKFRSCRGRTEDYKRHKNKTEKKSEFCLLFHNSEFILRFKKVSSIFLHGYLSPKKSCPCELCLAKYVRMKKNTERDLTHFFYLDLTCLSHCWDAVWKQEAEGVSSVWSCCSLKHQQAQTEARRRRFL